MKETDDEAIKVHELQIIGILKELEAGLGAKELCRKHGVSDATFYKWLGEFGGMEVSDASKLNSPEAKNARLRKLLTEQMMDVSGLKEMPGKTSETWCSAARRGLDHETERISPGAGLCLGRDRSTRLSAAADTVGRR